jgi:hypothetical protein
LILNPEDGILVPSPYYSITSHRMLPLTDNNVNTLYSIANKTVSRTRPVFISVQKYYIIVMKF